MAWFALMGFLLFGVGHGLAVTGLVLAAMGYANEAGAGWIIALVAAGELTILGSVLVLGDNAKIRTTTAGRHVVGIALLITHLTAYFLVWTAGILAYSRATEANPFPSVLGLRFEEQGPAFIWGVIAAELLFALGIYVLGPAWWARFKRLFRYQSAMTPPEPEEPKPPATFRYRFGLGVFIVGNVLATTGILLPVFGLAKGRMVGVIAVIMAVGEIVSLSSIFLLGREGFKELKSRLFAALKRTPSGEPVSHRRHRAGSTLVLLHVATQFAAVLFPIAAHCGAVAEGAFPTVLGLAREEQLRWFLGLLVASEALFFAGVYTLGSDWWGRFQSLFTIPGGSGARNE